MILAIPDLLTADEVARLRALIDTETWADGAASAGADARRVKNNEQLHDGGDGARQARTIVLDALGRSALFISAALPQKIVPPMFNRYGVGQAYGAHIDNAVRGLPDHGRMRADLSATLFLEQPQSYEGGDLVVDDVFGSHRVKLPAGHLLLYPASSLHRVEPVTQGRRVASIFWVQSMVRDAESRHILFDLDASIQSLPADAAARVRLTGIYHNLLRKWAEV